MFFQDISLRQCELRPRLQQLLRLFIGISWIKSRKWTTTKKRGNYTFKPYIPHTRPFLLDTTTSPRSSQMRWMTFQRNKVNIIIIIILVIYIMYCSHFMWYYHLLYFFSVSQNFFFVLGIPGIPNPAAFIPFFASFSLPLGAAVATFMAIVAVRWQDEDDDEKEESFSDVKMHKNEIFILMKVLPKN